MESELLKKMWREKNLLIQFDFDLNQKEIRMK